MSRRYEGLGRIQARTGLAIGKIVKQLRPLRSATIVINGATQSFPPEIPEAQRKILTHLAVKPGYLSEMSKLRATSMPPLAPFLSIAAHALTLASITSEGVE